MLPNDHQEAFRPTTSPPMFSVESFARSPDSRGDAADKKCADTAASYRRLVAMLDGFPGCLSTGPFGAAGDVLFIGSTGSAAPLMEYCGVLHGPM